MRKFTLTLLSLSLGVSQLAAQSVTIDASAGGRRQVIDGFGTCLAGDSGEKSWMQDLYYDDAHCSILRMDLVPRFKAPYSDFTYNSPWFHNSPALPGPENNNVRTYTNATDYTRAFAGRSAPIAVMGDDIDQNIQVFDYENVLPRAAGVMARKGTEKRTQLGDFKLIGSIWSPAPWLKVSSGNTYTGPGGILPVSGTPFPFIWTENFVGGKLDVSDTPRAEFGNTSALTQFARSTAAYVRGFQNLNDVRFYALSIQNELNFETFYNSCTYPLTSQYIAALKAVRTEFNKYPDLADIKLIGPEDLLGGSAYGMWQFGGGNTTVHKNLQYLTELAKDPEAQAIVDFYCIHGYAPDGVSSGGADATLWDWWANGWSTSPAVGLPDTVPGFRSYNKKSWMTETSGEKAPWLFPASGFPNDGGFSIALKIHQALTTGEQSAWVYWQMADGSVTGESTLTDEASGANSGKYTAFKHFARYIRPNAVRLESTVSGASNLSVSSYLHEADQSLTVVLVNSNDSPQNVTVNVPATGFTLNSFQAYTSSDNSLWQNSTLPVADGNVTVSIPAYGVATLYGIGATAPPDSTLRDPENPTNTVSGLNYSYYEGTWNVLPNFDTLTSVKTGTITTLDLAPRNRDENFAFTYQGFIDVPTDGTYTFYTSSDDGSKLLIGNTEVVDNDGSHAMQERSGTIGLKAGKHAITVNFFELSGNQVLSASYSGPGISKTIIPDSAFYRINDPAAARPVLSQSSTNSTRNALGTFEVYPNPTKGELTLFLPNAKAGEVSIVLTDAVSKVALKEARVLGTNQQVTLSLDKLPDGYYFLIVTQNGQSAVKPIVVAH